MGNIDDFINKLSDKKLIRVHKELAKEKFDGLVKSLSQMMVDEYSVDPLYVTTVLRNKVNDILSKKYIKIKERKKKKNESKKS